MSKKLPQPAAGAFRRRSTDYSGLFFDEFAADSAWIRETARLRLPPLDGVDCLILRGEYRAHPESRGLETGLPGLKVSIDGRYAGLLSTSSAGPWELRLPLPAGGRSNPRTLTMSLTGAGLANAFAWLGRVTGLGSLQRFRQQNKNRQLRIATISTDKGEAIYDFSQRLSPYSREFARRHARLGLNIAGFLTADLGVGESARCMVRAADAAEIPAALVQLKLHCRNRLGDPTYAGRLQDSNPHGVNVIHIDPPASSDIDYRQGKKFRAGKYNIGYFAWELPEFPDAWVPSFHYYHEIWCPSEFTRQAISMKSPLPVITMPHAIGFPRPAGDGAKLRARFGVPTGPFIFLTLFDLNSYSARKNPRAAIAAFRQSGLNASDAFLVVKVQNAAANPAEYAALEADLRDLPNTVLISETLTREEIYALEAACDAFVSLHRAEGFGLAVAECMALGKPVIATDWSATAEFVSKENGCPVRYQLTPPDGNHGPYGRGSVWAEADPSHAAEWMRRLASDRSLAARLGAAAQATIETRFSPAVIGERYRRRLEAIAEF